MMGACITLYVLAWTAVRQVSALAAVIVSVVALAIPPIAVILANRGGNRHG